MAADTIGYPSLFGALVRMFGRTNTDPILKYLDEQGVATTGGKVDVEKLDSALQSLFGSGAAGVIRGLMAQKEPVPRLAR
jgi:hypothetical protein